MKKSSKARKSSSGRLDIRTVASEAGVSVATVSRVINQLPSVDEKLRKRVWNAIQKLGYVPNTQARALVSGKSKLLGVIISDITNPFFPELIQGFEDKAVELGYETLIGSTNYDLQRMERCIQRMLERKVEGVAVMTFGIEEPLLDRLSSQGIPMVFIDMAPRRKNISIIPVEYDKGITEAVDHLNGLGHRKIAFIAGPKRLHSAVARLRAFETATANAGLRIPSSYIVDGDHTTEGGTRGAEHLLSLSTPPTAILCSNDMTAIGAAQAIVRAGLSIPNDISLVGFDDIRMTEFMMPPLTTVRMSGRDIAARAVTALVHTSDPVAPVTTTLIVRQSTAAPHDASTKPRKPSRRS